MPIAAGVRPTPKKSGVVYDNIPEDTYQAEIVDVDHYRAKDPFKPGDDTEYDYLKATFIILQDETFEGPANGEQNTRGRRQWLDNIKWSMSPPGDYPASKLYRIASASNGGRVFNKAECNSFDPNTLIGKQLKIVIKEKPGKDDRVFNNITDFVQARKLMKPWDQDTEGYRAKNPLTPQVNDVDMDDESVPF